MKILVPVDDTQSSTNAIEIVANRSWPPGTTVRALSIAEHVAGVAHSRDHPVELARQEMTKRADGLTARVADVLREKGLEVDSAVRFGDPVSQIVNEAREWQADQIVIGAGAYEKEGKEPSGVVQQVEIQASCPVELVASRRSNEENPQ